jgi:hypothetical protein
MVDDISGHPNVGVAIICQYRMAAVGIAGTTREIAAGDVDLEAMAGAKGVRDVAEIYGQALDTIWRKMARLAGRVAIHGGMHARLDNVNRRLDRVERRLDLVDESASSS